MLVMVYLQKLLHYVNKVMLVCDLYEEKIPLDPTVISTCEEFNIDSTTIALNGGEDYELLFTISQDDFTKIKANPHLSIIGHMKDENEGVHLVTRSNTRIPLIAQGWKNFD